MNREILFACLFAAFSTTLSAHDEPFLQEEVEVLEVEDEELLFDEAFAAIDFDDDFDELFLDDDELELDIMSAKEIFDQQDDLIEEVPEQIS